MPVVVTVDVEFGDRPSPDPLGNLERLCGVIDAHRAPVTFFIQGRWARTHPDRVAELAALGSIGLHGYSHVDYRRLTPDGVRAELSDGLAALAAAAPDSEVTFTRLPYGYGSDDPTICALLGEAGLVPVGWDFSTFDWDDTLPFDQRAARARASVPHGGVVLFHSWPAATPDLVAALLDDAGDDVAPLASVDLAGRQHTGRTIHVERTDPRR